MIPENIYVATKEALNEERDVTFLYTLDSSLKRLSFEKDNLCKVVSDHLKQIFRKRKEN